MITFCSNQSVHFFLSIFCNAFLWMIFLRFFFMCSVVSIFIGSIVNLQLNFYDTNRNCVRFFSFFSFYGFFYSVSFFVVDFSFFQFQFIVKKIFFFLRLFTLAFPSPYPTAYNLSIEFVWKASLMSPLPYPVRKHTLRLIRCLSVSACMVAASYHQAQFECGKQFNSVRFSFLIFKL